MYLLDLLPAPEIATVSKSSTGTGRSARLRNHATELGTSRESYAGLLSKLPGIGPCKRENPAERSQDQSYHEAAHASQDAYDREGEDDSSPQMVLNRAPVKHNGT